MCADANIVVTPNATETVQLVETLVTCPFVGRAISEGKLSVRNSIYNPLASIEGLRKLGNSGGGDLGEVLVLFARGNQAFMRGDEGQLDKLVPSGLFSLEFPGSQGAHPGHSGILMGDPEKLGSGRLSLPDFGRLVSRARDGVIKRSDVGRFIAENLSRDEKAKVSGPNIVEALGGDIVEFGATLVPALLGKLTGSDDEGNATVQVLEEKFAKLIREDNLVGSAGEFGLLFAFVANKLDAKEVDGEPTVTVEDLEVMFIKKRLPEGFESWRKLRADWIKNTFGLIVSASKEYRDLMRGQ